MNYLEFRKQLDLEIRGSYRLIKELPDHEVGEVWRAFDTGMDELITIFTKDGEHSYNLDPEDWEVEFFYSYYDSDWFEPISDKPEKIERLNLPCNSSDRLEIKLTKEQKE